MEQKNRKITIDWKPDKNGKVSLADQIIAYFKAHVYRGDWICGDILPSQRALAEIFGVNRSTVVEALSELASLGILEAKTGKGTRIANNSWSFLVSNPSPDWSNYLSHGFHKPNIPTIQAINRYEFDDSIIRLGTGEISPRLMNHEAFSKALMDMAEDEIPYNYLEPLGLYELRVELCNYLKKYNLNIKPSEILIVSGSLQALQLISISLLGGDSTVYIEENSYVKSLRVFEFPGIHIKPVPMDGDGIVPWAIDESSLPRINSLLYTIPTFHNPTGITMGESRRAELLKWCRKNRLPIIEDDAYRDLYFDAPPPNPIKSMDDSGNVLYLGSVSKSLAPGLRIGWVVGPESIIERLGDIKMQTDYGASSVSQWLLTYLLRNGLYENHIRKLRSQLKDRSRHMIRILEEYFSDLATWNTPAGGFYIWLELKKAISTEKLFNKALRQGILINPGYIYGFRKNNCIRLSYSYASYEEMEKGLKTLAGIVRSMM